MTKFATLADCKAFENEQSREARDFPKTIYQVLSNTAEKFGNRNALSF